VTVKVSRRAELHEFLEVLKILVSTPGKALIGTLLEIAGVRPFPMTHRYPGRLTSTSPGADKLEMIQTGSLPQNVRNIDLIRTEISFAQKLTASYLFVVCPSLYYSTAAFRAPRFKNRLP